MSNDFELGGFTLRFWLVLLGSRSRPLAESRNILLRDGRSISIEIYCKLKVRLNNVSVKLIQVISQCHIREWKTAFHTSSFDDRLCINTLTANSFHRRVTARLHLLTLIDNMCDCTAQLIEYCEHAQNLGAIRCGAIAATVTRQTTGPPTG